MDFRKRYDRREYISFFQNQFLPEDFEKYDEKLEVGFKTQFIQNITKIGEVRSLGLNIYEITHLSEKDPRVSLSRESFRMLAQYGQQKALAVFISPATNNYRLSLITIDLKWEDGKRVKKEFSNPRRFSFFLGPDSRTHTPYEYLVKKARVKDFDDLKERFSIEVVNKEFYTSIAILFTKLAGGKRTIGAKKYDEKGSLKLPSTLDDTLLKEFTMRLIGRLVFCWFLKKKKAEGGLSLLPEEVLSTEAVSKESGYYHKILEPLFFQVLNTPVKERSKSYQSLPWSQIPFLNGGLFSPHLHDYYELGVMEISKNINTLRISDNWFKELFEIFETYNFTIDENTSMDVELSIDPEMLGRIFENLLAEISPETGESARKATGSFYTPRQIVEYMVNESLKRYLLTKTKLNEQKIAALLAYEVEEVEFSDSQKEEILDALDAIKIIDPACGSGAFPMGILQKMLLILQKVDSDSKVWFKKQIIKIKNPILRQEIGNKLKPANVNYVHKLGIIQSAIYGVDIQPIAVEVSKLRFFLSLIVDEIVDDSKENRGVEPLPNLEFKFVCANSLIGLPKVESQQTMFEAIEDINILKNLRSEYLRSYGEQKKIIENKFQEIQDRMFRHSTNWGGKDSQTLKLSQWKPFSDERCDWFDPGWMFGVKEGFDVVIANPPYVTTKYGKISADLKKIYHKCFETAYDKLDLYILFIEKAIKLSREHGLTTFITPWNFLANFYSFKIREYLLENTKIKLFNKLRPNVFGSVIVDNIISIFEKTKNNKDNQIVFDDLFDKNNQKYIKQDMYLKRNKCIFSFPGNEDANEILQKMQKGSLELYKIALNYIGIMTGDQKKMIANTAKFKNSKHVLGGRDIAKWKFFDRGNFVNFDKSKIHSNDNEDVYLSKKKILLRKTGRKFVACLDKKQYYTIQSLYNIIVKNNKYTEEYLLALLNSSLFTFIYNKFFITNPEVFPYVKRKHLDQFPIKIVSEEEQKPFINLVNNIHAINKDEDYPNNSAQQAKIIEYECQIDQLVCKLYGLTKEEIQLVDNFRKEN